MQSSKVAAVFIINVILFALEKYAAFICTINLADIRMLLVALLFC